MTIKGGLSYVWGQRGQVKKETIMQRQEKLTATLNTTTEIIHTSWWWWLRKTARENEMRGSEKYTGHVISSNKTGDVCMYKCNIQAHSCSLSLQCACAILSSVNCAAVHYFSILSHKRHDFRRKEKDIQYKMCVFISSTTLCLTNFSF
jgi:hypothetical protein